jgi:two-component system sensor histidine kinase LytS
MLFFTLIIVSGAVELWALFSPEQNLTVIAIAGIFLTLCLVALISLLLNPDSVRARQSDAMLKLASQMLACMKDGLNPKTAEKVCRLLLPATAASAVAITDTGRILGYVGAEQETNKAGDKIRTLATQASIADGRMRILLSPQEIGFPAEAKSINAAIVVPLNVSGRVVGTLKFYFRKANLISETQKSIAEGFGNLLSTQMAASALEEQTKLATTMELKALQSQINPHFLFNTINTIASLVRTNPSKARMLLREFAVFYRRTLEDSTDLILFSREIEQTLRYFSFEVARFGEERISMEVDIHPEVEDMMVPPFLIQPLVENAVRHALPSGGKMEITLTSEVSDKTVHLFIKDSGVGMAKDVLENIMHSSSTTGLGIAVGNVNERIKGYYGPNSRMIVESIEGVGTTVILVLEDALSERYQQQSFGV